MAARHNEAGFPIVSFLVAPGHEWWPLGRAADVLFETASALVRSSRSGGRSARWAKSFAQFGPVGFVVWPHFVMSPRSGWGAHAHVDAFVRDLPSGVEGFDQVVRTAVVAEFGEHGVDDAFHTGRTDTKSGMTAVVVQDSDGRWQYFAADEPEHPEHESSRLYGAFKAAQSGWGDDHMDHRPEDRPSADVLLGDWRPWRDDRPFELQGPEHWHIDDWLFRDMVDAWPGGKSWDPIADLGALTLMGSTTAADLLREFALTMQSWPRRWGRRYVTNGLRKAYSVAPDPLWCPPDDKTAVLMERGLLEELPTDLAPSILAEFADRRFVEGLALLAVFAGPVHMEITDSGDRVVRRSTEGKNR